MSSLRHTGTDKADGSISAPPVRKRAGRVEPATDSLTRADKLTIALVVLTVVSVAAATFWWLGLLSSGVWTNEGDSRVRILQNGKVELDRAFANHPDAPFAIVFYSESCLHCRQMRAPFLESSRQFQSVHFVAIPVDIPSNRELAVQHAIEFVPSLHFIPSGANPKVHVPYTGDPKLKHLTAFLRKEIGKAAG
jgi:thiol-disulfide isomerase/thioredoxin